MVSPAGKPRAPLGPQTTASTSNPGGGLQTSSNKSHKTLSLAENSTQRWRLQVFTLPLCAKSAYRNGKDTAVRDQMPRGAAPAKEEKEWLLIP